MPLNFTDGKQMLFDTIRHGLRHRDYKRVCDLAKEYTAYVTGEDIRDLLVQFAPREDEKAFNQRVAITEIVTPYIANRIMTPMYKAGRTLAAETMEWVDDKKLEDTKDKFSSEERKQKLMDAIGSYHGEVSVDDFLAYRHVELEATDANTFLVTDFEGEVDPSDPNTKAEPYPFEVNSEEAINFKYKNNKLQFLIVLNEVNNLKKYTTYLDKDWIIAQQITEEEYKVRQNEKGIEIFFKDPDKKSTDEIYVITTAEHKASGIPAKRVGHKKDLKTRGRTCVPMMHAARAFFKKSIKTISEFDLTQALHIFPQKISYDTVCPGDVAKQVICRDGKTPDGEICPQCKGTGFNDHRSSQDIIRVKMPGDLKDVVSLENFIAYKHPPAEILEFLKKLGLYEIPELAVKAVYTSELFSADTITTTATEKNIDLESVYDALKSFTDQRSELKKHIVMTIASYIDVSKGLVYEHKFPKDFKMKSITMLLADLTALNNTGAPSYIKKAVVSDIAQKLYADKPDELLKIETKEKFHPFSGKSEGEIATVISERLTPRFNIILYANFDQIFDELDQENSKGDISFYKMEMSKQRSLLKTKVEQFVKAIADEQAAERAADFGKVTEEEEEAAE